MDAHDDSKAGAGLAENFSIYNLSLDMIQRANWTGDLYPEKWNSLERVCIATQILLDYIRGDAPRDIPRSTVDLPLAALGLNFHRCGACSLSCNEHVGRTYWWQCSSFVNQNTGHQAGRLGALLVHASLSQGRAQRLLGQHATELGQIEELPGPGGAVQEGYRHSDAASPREPASDVGQPEGQHLRAAHLRHICQV